MKKKKSTYLVQITYRIKKYEIGLFYILDKKDIGFKDGKLYIKDGDITFVDGEEGIKIDFYNDYKIEIVEHDERNLRVFIEANRHRFYVFKHLQTVKKECASYSYYYRKQIN